MFDGADPRSSVPQRVLLVSEADDDRARLMAILSDAGFLAVQASASAEAVGVMAALSFDLVIVDDNGGSDLWRDLAAQGPAPLLLLAEAAGVIERVLALELGADAVLAKPAHPRELLSTAKALMRRTRRVLAGVARAGGRTANWALDIETRRFTGPNGKTAALSPAELAMLRLFLDRPGVPLSAERVAAGGGGVGPAAAVKFRVTLARLRRRLEQAGYPAGAIRTIRGVGYVFLPDESSPAEPGVVTARALMTAAAGTAGSLH